MPISRLLALFLAAAFSLSSASEMIPLPDVDTTPIQSTEAADFTAADAVTYVDGTIKKIYLGQFDPDYMALVDIDEAEAKEDYMQGMAAEVDFLSYYYDISSPTKELTQELTELFIEIYQHTSYEILDVAQLSDGSFAVQISVEPIDIYQRLEAEAETFLAPFYEKYPSDVWDTMTDEEYEAADQEWGRMIAELLRSLIPDIGHLPAKTLLLHVVEDKDGSFWMLDEDDLVQLDTAIIALNGSSL